MTPSQLEKIRHALAFYAAYDEINHPYLIGYGITSSMFDQDKGERAIAALRLIDHIADTGKMVQDSYMITVKNKKFKDAQHALEFLETTTFFAASHIRPILIIILKELLKIKDKT